VGLYVDRRTAVGLGEIMFAYVKQNNFVQCGTQCWNFGNAVTYPGDGGSTSRCSSDTVLADYTVTHTKAVTFTFTSLISPNVRV
jgi:hypothetical protein